MLHAYDYKNVRHLLLSVSVFMCLIDQAFALFLRPGHQLPLLACIHPLPLLRTDKVDLFKTSAKLKDAKKSAPTARTQSPGCRRWRFPIRTDDKHHETDSYPPSRPPSPNLFIFS